MATTDGFWMTAFTAAEQARVLNTVRGAAADGPAPWVYVGIATGYGNPAGWVQDWSPTNAVAPVVTMNVFALSNAEVWTYFGESTLGGGFRRTDGHARITDFGAAKGAYRHGGTTAWREGHGPWWTRSAGRTSTFASVVGTAGYVGAHSSVTRPDRGVRPALTVDIGS